MFTSSWKKPVSLLWVDGEHSYQGVKRDFESWSPHLAADALIAFDDASDHDLGPRRLIDELTSFGDYEEVMVVGKIAVIHKCIVRNLS
jgi:hypothetical protein